MDKVFKDFKISKFLNLCQTLYSNNFKFSLELSCDVKGWSEDEIDDLRMEGFINSIDYDEVNETLIFNDNHEKTGIIKLDNVIQVLIRIGDDNEQLPAKNQKLSNGCEIKKYFQVDTHECLEHDFNDNDDPKPIEFFNGINGFQLSDKYDINLLSLGSIIEVSRRDYSDSSNGHDLYIVEVKRIQ
jgi:hypothetical protein